MSYLVRCAKTAGPLASWRSMEGAGYPALLELVLGLFSDSFRLTFGMFAFGRSVALKMLSKWLWGAPGETKNLPLGGPWIEPRGSQERPKSVQERPRASKSVQERPMSVPRASQERPSAPQERPKSDFGSSWRRFGSLLGPFRSHLGAVLEPFWTLESMLEAIWCNLAKSSKT